MLNSLKGTTVSFKTGALGEIRIINGGKTVATGTALVYTDGTESTEKMLQKIMTDSKMTQGATILTLRSTGTADVVNAACGGVVTTVNVVALTGGVTVD